MTCLPRGEIETRYFAAECDSVSVFCIMKTKRAKNGFHLLFTQWLKIASFWREIRVE